MPEDKELANMLRTIIQEELRPVNEKLTALETGQVELRTDVQRIEATVNDIRATNRWTHKEVFSRLDYIVEDIKRFEPQEKKAVR
jgi:predicted  nucleic acid-binding Zn-ribbon protein